MKKGKILPPELINACVAMLRPYYPGLSPAGLIEILERRAPAPERSSLTKHEAANFLGVSLPSIDRYIKRGTLRAYRLPPRLIRIDRADLERFLKSEEVTE